jgi:ABC-2 type transport system permease protein
MTSKSLFFKLIQEDGKRRLWAVTLAFLMFFFSLPVTIAMVIGESLKQEETIASIHSQLRHLMGFQNGFITFLLIALSIVMGVTSFSYLHSRQKVDFYHGIPVNRKHLFWANYLNGIFIVAVVYGVNLILTLGVTTAYGISPSALMGSVISGYLLFMLHYAMIYAVTVLAMIMTGSVIVGIFGTAVFEGYFTILLFILQGCYGYFFHTSYRSGEELFRPFLVKSSPYAIFIYNVALDNGGRLGAELVSQIIIVALLFVIFTFLCLFLYKKRGSESAKKAMAFKISMPIIRIPIVVLSSLSGCFVFWTIRSDMGWAVFGLLCGMFLSHCVIEIIYHFDFRKLFSNWKQMIASALVAAVIFGGFQMDLFGYDSYIPLENSIDSMAISLNNDNNWVSYGEAVWDTVDDYRWVYQSGDDYIFSHMKLENKAPALSMVKKAVEYNRGKNWDRLPDNDWDQSDRSCNFSVKYTLKNGKNVYRSYSLKNSEVKEELSQLYEDQDFIQAVYPIFSQTAENTSAVRVSRGSQSNIISRDKNGTDKAMTEKLLLAYQKDLSQLKVETMSKENPVASIQFMTKIQAEADSKRELNRNSWQYSDLTSRGYYPIYPSFTNTLNLLRECQLDVDSWNSYEEIKEITFDLSQLSKYDKDNYENSSSLYYTVSDPQLIAQIMSQAAIDEYAGMNPFGIWNTECISFSAVSSALGNRSEIQYIVPLKQLPDSVREALKP